MSKIQIVAISDMHGQLPERLPEADLLLIAGDISPCRFPGGNDEHVSVSGIAFEQGQWLRRTFQPWLERQPVKHTVATWGNHDWIGERMPDMVPKMPWDILNDRGIEWMGLKIYGTPWQPRFLDWAFNADEPELAKRWAAIPDDTDILVLHGPPHGYGDLALASSGIRNAPEHVGSPSLTKRIAEIKPRLAVFGHIHSGHGIYSLGETILANVSLVDEEYRMVNAPTEFTIDLSAIRIGDA